MEQAELKTQLEARRDEILVEMKEIDERLREPESPDDEDRATEREDDEVLEGLGNAVTEELWAIEDALRRMELGTYGVCTTCGNQINAKRLEAVPHTSLCINCASAA